MTKQAPLTDQELSEIRSQLLASRSLSWLGKRIKAVVTWVVTILGGVIFFWDQIEAWLRSLLNGS